MKSKVKLDTKMKLKKLNFDRAGVPRHMPERVFRDKNVCVTGRIEAYRGKPQIVVQEAGAVRIVEQKAP